MAGWRRKASELCVRLSKVIRQTKASGIEELLNRLEDEAAGQLFLYVPSSKAGYYRTINLFGPEVASKFSEATLDIEEAGNVLPWIEEPQQSFI
jgi:hypothetical protein